MKIVVKYLRSGDFECFVSIIISPAGISSGFGSGGPPGMLLNISTGLPWRKKSKLFTVASEPSALL